MRAFIAGATGATGQVFVPEAQRAGLELVVQVRPKSATKYSGPPAPRLFELSDPAALDEAMSGCDVAISMVGTMRKRFGSGDTYQVSDIDSAQQLVDSAKRVGVKRFILLGALGTSTVPGPYYDAKRAAEAIVVNSGLVYTLVRPSALHRDGRDGALPGWMASVEAMPELADQLKNVLPIPVRVVARAMVRIAQDNLHRNAIVCGRDLWPLGVPF